MKKLEANSINNIFYIYESDIQMVAPEKLTSRNLSKSDLYKELNEDCFCINNKLS